MRGLSLCCCVTCQNTTWGCRGESIHTSCQCKFNSLRKGTNQVSVKGSFHGREPGAHAVGGKTLKLKLKVFASIGGKWLNSRICGGSRLFGACVPPFIPAEPRLPIIGLSQRLERSRKSHRRRLKGCGEQGGSKQEQRGVQRSSLCSCRRIQR